MHGVQTIRVISFLYWVRHCINPSSICETFYNIHPIHQEAVRLVTCYSNTCACRKAIKVAIRVPHRRCINPHYYFREEVSSCPQVGRNPQGSGQRNLPEGFRHVRSEESYCSLALSKIRTCHESILRGELGSP